MRFIPEAISDKIVIKQREAITVSKGGIELVNPNPPMEGTVVSVGPGRLNQYGLRNPLSVEPGDIVVYAKYGGAEVRMDDEDGKSQTYIVIKEDDILCVLHRYDELYADYMQFGQGDSSVPDPNDDPKPEEPAIPISSTDPGWDSLEPGE